MLWGIGCAAAQLIFFLTPTAKIIYEKRSPPTCAPH